jgi:hypothetical protein
VVDQTIECFDMWAHEADSLPETELADAIYAHLAIDRTGDPDADVFHVTAHPRGLVVPEYDDEIHYWRRVGFSTGSPNQSWEGPVTLDIDAGYYSHHVAVDPTDPNVAVIYVQDQTPGNPDELMQIVYMQSSTNGADWIADGAPIYPSPLTSLPEYDFVQVTSYADPSGPEAWRECSGEFDLDGRLHIIWVEQAVAGVGYDCRIEHWDDATMTEHAITEALGWANVGTPGVYDLWLASPQMALGDGSTTCLDNLPSQTNRNYLYLTYERYGGPAPADAADASQAGFQNLDICITASADGGQTWVPPMNSTLTKSPQCAAGSCLSERDPSIAKTVNDTIHILYVRDRDAGDAPLGQGSWTFNEVMYFRIPGFAHDSIFCPPATICDCAYQSDFDEDGFVTSLDLSAEIDALFAGGADPSDPNCPTSRGDFDCDGFNTSLDLSGLIDHLFVSGPGPCDPCAQ